MKTALLGEVVRIVSGATPSTGIAEYWNGDVPWVTPADLSKLDGAFITETPRTLTEAGVRSCATTILPIGSVLLSSRAPIGHVAVNEVPMATNQGFKSLVPGDRVHAKFLYHWVRANKDYLQSLGNGATFKELSKKTVEQVQIPLPSLDEQRRLAAILDHADALRTKRRQVLAHLDALTQSIFHDMFGDPDAAVRTRPFGEVAALLGGRNLVADDALAASEYRVLKISAVTSGQFKPQESKPLPEEYVPPESHLVRRGDLLMSRANTAALVGAVAYVHETPANLALPDKVWRFAWRDEESVPVFYHSLLQTKSVRRKISQLASGTGGSMKNVSKEKLNAMKLPLVSPSDQRAFARAAGSVSVQRDRVEKLLASESSLFASLQSRAFEGEL